MVSNYYKCVYFYLLLKPKIKKLRAKLNNPKINAYTKSVLLPDYWQKRYGKNSSKSSTKRKRSTHFEWDNFETDDNRDNNISSVQYVLFFSLLEKNDYKNLASIKTDTVYKV